MLLFLRKKKKKRSPLIAYIKRFPKIFDFNLLYLVFEVDEIDLALRNIQANTSTLCSSPDGDSESFTVSIALVNRTRIADLSSASL